MKNKNEAITGSKSLRSGDWSGQMKKLQWKGGTLLSPAPAALVTCGTMEQSNLLTVAWTGIVCSDPPKTYISVRPSRFSHRLIRESGEFVINLTTEELVRRTDACGVLTGAKVDKFKRFDLHKEAANTVACPLLAEAPLSLECHVTDVISLGSHDMFLADITAVDVAPELLDDTGKLHLDRAHLVAYSHGEYYALGRRLGSFGFSVRKKRTHGPRRS